MEADAPGFHTTQTIDYVVLLSGQVWLVVDEDEALLGPGDTVIQLGSRHAWQNRGTQPATLAVVLVGAKVTGA
jgi:quercetin dioxygenase-like cupin family protein